MIIRSTMLVSMLLLSGCAQKVNTVLPRTTTQLENTKVDAFCASLLAEWAKRHGTYQGEEYFRRYLLEIGLHMVENTANPPLRFQISIAEEADLADVLSAIAVAYDKAQLDDADIIIDRRSDIVARLYLSRRTEQRTRPKSWYVSDEDREMSRGSHWYAHD